MDDQFCKQRNKKNHKDEVGKNHKEGNWILLVEGNWNARGWFFFFYY